MPLREPDCCGSVLSKEIILCCLFSGKLAGPVLHEYEENKPSSGRGEERVGAPALKNPNEFRKLDWQAWTPKGCRSLLKHTPLSPCVGYLTIVFTRLVDPPGHKSFIWTVWGPSLNERFCTFLIVNICVSLLSSCPSVQPSSVPPPLPWPNRPPQHAFSQSDEGRASLSAAVRARSAPEEADNRLASAL